MAQWNIQTQDYLNQERSLFEVVGVASSDGQPISETNRFPVSIGGTNITINGDVTIPGIVTVTSSASNPIHNHIVEVGTSSTLTTPYLPVGISSLLNTVSVSNTAFYVTGVGSTVNITGTVAISTTNNVFTLNQDNPGFDAFGRQRVSEPFTLGDYSHVYGEEVELLTKVVGAASTTTSSPDTASIILQVGSGSTDYVIHQSRMYHHYMPGKSQYVLSSFAFGTPRNNTYKEIGYFDDYNGVMLRQVGVGTTATYSIVKRSSVTGVVVEEEITQSSWSVDRLDGTGKSGISLDFTKAQLFYADFQWLGVGRIRVGFEHKGLFYLAHEFYHTNVIDFVYWSIPSLPVRCGMRNVGSVVGITSMNQMCSTVMSEGGYVESGVDFASYSDAISVPKGTTRCVMAIRLKNTYKGLANRSIVRIRDLDILSDSAPCLWRLWRLPNNAGITTGTWVSADGGSTVEYNETVGVGYTTTGGERQSAGWIAANNPSGKQSSGQIQTTPTSAKRGYLSQNIDSNDSNIYAVLVTNLTANTDTNVYCSMQWRETR